MRIAQQSAGCWQVGDVCGEAVDQAPVAVPGSNTIHLLAHESQSLAGPRGEIRPGGTGGTGGTGLISGSGDGFHPWIA